MRGGDHPTRYKFQDRGPEPSEAVTAERMTDRTGDPISDRNSGPRLGSRIRPGLSNLYGRGVEILGRQGGRPRENMYVVMADASKEGSSETLGLTGGGPYVPT